MPPCVPALLALSLLSADDDRPLRLRFEAGGAWIAQAGTGTQPQRSALENARRLTNQLRYEEAVVEYHRYLALPARPVAERARALFDLAFLHLVLGDERSARLRASEALELDPSLRLSPDAPAKQQDFLRTTRKGFEARTRIDVLPPEDPDAPQRIRARVIDPEKRAKTVMLRHALSPTGPFFGQQMRCADEVCTAEILAPKDVETYTAWYYVEATDAEGTTLSRGAAADAPLRVSIVAQEAWYRSPWVYAGGAAVILSAAAVFYAASGR